MRRTVWVLVLLALVSSVVIPIVERVPARAGSAPPMKQSNPGQLNIVTVNAAQVRILDKQSFEMLFELGRALRQRPGAFDGGPGSAVAVPDVILLQEMRFSNLEIFKRLLKQRFPHMYEIVGAERATGKLLVNLDTVTPTRRAGTWDDVCLGGTDVEGGRTYQWVGLTDNATGAPLTAASVHFSNKYPPGGDCLIRNIEAMRAELDGAPGAVVAGGDFNKRAVDVVYECDPDERSSPLPWYTAMRAPSDTGAPYEDAALVSRRRDGRSLANQWTYERKASNLGCRGAFSIKRSRIDYLFVRDATVAGAGADDPGWGGSQPGRRHPTNFKYSDHRFVSARIILNTLARPASPSAVPAAGGVVRLAWEAAPNATRYVVLRAVVGNPYTPIASVSVAKSVAYEDASTLHGRRYRYAIAPVGVGGQGWESRPTWVTTDARGPVVVAVSPPRGATRVGRGTDIEVRFNEKVARDSVSQKSIRLTRRGRHVDATVVQVAPRVLVLDPARRLRRKTTYRVVVGSVSDDLGNRGTGTAWKFTTRK